MLTHIDKSGNAKMVDISEKKVTYRKAIACSSVIVGKKIFYLIKENQIAKGDVLSTAKIAGIMAAKMCGNLIPLCHPLNLTYVDITFQLDEKNFKVIIFSEAVIDAKTGVEMEALTAASVAALTIYDMCKGVDKSLTIGETFLVKKSGGKSGIFRNKEKLRGYVSNVEITDKKAIVEIVGILPEFLDKNDKLQINGKPCSFTITDNKIVIDLNNNLTILKGDKIWIE